MNQENPEELASQDEGGLAPDEEFLSVEEEEGLAGPDEPGGDSDAKVDWDGEPEDGADTDAQSGGVMIGLTALGPVVQVTSPNGDVAQKVVSIDELFQLGGQAIGIASFVMQMSMQAQMQEQARIQEMMARGEEQTASGLYVKKR
jgi:hypothetical protein